MPDRQLDRLLERWVAEGLVSSEQAVRIAAAEAAREPETAGTAPSERRSMTVEALGYLGGALAAIAGFLAVHELWPGITTAAELAFAALGTAVLLAAGAAVRARRDPALERLRSVLWLLSTACLTAFAALLGGPVLGWSGPEAGLLSAVAATAFALPLWRRTRAPLQQLSVFAGIAATAGTAVAAIDDDLAPWGPGVAIWLVSALWVAAAARRLVPPPMAGMLFGTLGLLMGAAMTMEEAAGHVLALATVAALLAAGVRLHRLWLLALGTWGVLLVVPQTASRYLPRSAAAPIAVFAVGLTLLGVAVWLAKHNRATPRHP